MKPKKNSIKYIIIGIAVIIILLIILKQTGVIGKDNVQLVSVETAKITDINEFVSSSGKIQPINEVKLSPDVSGEIVELFVKEGDIVKKGDCILKIKPNLYESVLERNLAAGSSANANLTNSQARLEQVKAQFVQIEQSYKRNQKLHEQGVISQSEYEAAFASYQVAKADVAAAESNVKSATYSILSAHASIKEAKENLRKTIVYAPIDGVITALNVKLGERVVGTEMMAGTEMLRIADLNLMEVIVDVSENDIVKIKLNDTADIEVDAYHNKKFIGIVSSIANSATVQSTSTDQVTNFKVKVKISPESFAIYNDTINKYPFRPGMSATVDIKTKSIRNTLAVPLSAVTTRIDTLAKQSEMPANEEDNIEVETNRKNQQEVVFVFNNNKVEQRNVKIGIQDNYNIQIIEGLKENEEVVVAPYNLISKILYHDMPVQKVDKERLYNNIP